MKSIVSECLHINLPHLKKEKRKYDLHSQGADPLPLPLRVAKAGRNHLNEEISQITPLLPTGIGERYSQTISNLEHAALLRRCEFRAYKLGKPFSKFITVHYFSLVFEQDVLEMGV